MPTGDGSHGGRVRRTRFLDGPRTDPRRHVLLSGMPGREQGNRPQGILDGLFREPGRTARPRFARRDRGVLLRLSPVPRPPRDPRRVEFRVPRNHPANAQLHRRESTPPSCPRNRRRRTQSRTAAPHRGRRGRRCRTRPVRGQPRPHPPRRPGRGTLAIGDHPARTPRRRPRGGPDLRGPERPGGQRPGSRDRRRPDGQGQRKPRLVTRRMGQRNGDPHNPRPPEQQKHHQKGPHPCAPK